MWRRVDVVEVGGVGESDGDAGRSLWQAPWWWVRGDVYGRSVCRPTRDLSGWSLLHHPLYYTLLLSPPSCLLSSSSSPPSPLTQYPRKSPFSLLPPLPPLKGFQWSHFKLDFLFQSCLADVLTYLKRYSDTRCVFAFSGWIKNGQALFPLKSTFLRKKPGQSGQGPHCVCCTISACTGDHIISCTVLYQPEKHYITSYELYTPRMEKLPHFPGFFYGWVPEGQASLITVD